MRIIKAGKLGTSVVDFGVNKLAERLIFGKRG
jgi:hypothetical protein